jgi:hypothetical protein
LTKLHQDPVPFHAVASVLELVRLGNGIRERIAGIVAGQYLLHLERWTPAASDDRLGPLLDRLVVFAPVVLAGVPRATVLEPQRCEPESAHVELGGLDLAGEVRMAGVAPLLSWLHGHDPAGYHIPEPTRAKGDSPVAAQQSAARGALRDREHDQLDGPAQVEVLGHGFVLALAVREPGSSGRVGLEAEPLAIGGDVTGAARTLREHDIGDRDHVLGAVLAPAPRRQPAALAFHRNRSRSPRLARR